MHIKAVFIVKISLKTIFTFNEQFFNTDIYLKYLKTKKFKIYYQRVFLFNLKIMCFARKTGDQ